MRLYFARHGESEANLARVIANRGWGYPLTDRGRRQAFELARRLETELRPNGAIVGGPPRIHSSPLQRAMETAEIVAELLGSEIVPTDALREADCGVIEGRADPDAWAAHDAVQARWRTGATADRIEGGESLDDVLGRFGTFVRSVMADAEPGAAIVCIGHGSVYRFALPALLVRPSGDPIGAVEVGHAEAIVAEPARSAMLVEIERWSAAGGS